MQKLHAKGHVLIINRFKNLGVGFNESLRVNESTNKLTFQRFKSTINTNRNDLQILNLTL